MFGLKKMGQWFDGLGLHATDADDATTVNGLASSSLVQTTGTQSIAGVKTFTSGVKSTEKLVVPLDQPSSLENGDIWIA